MVNSQESVYVVGVGMTPVGEHWELSLRHLALEAISAARSEALGARPQAVYVANMLSPALSGQSHLGALLTDFAGLRGAEAATIEAAGASGGVALRQAYLAIRSGAVDVAMAVGVEKVTDRTAGAVEAALATSGDAEYESVQGMTATAQAALLMRRYMHEHDVAAEAFAGFSLTAHQNAVTNPKAMFRKAISQDQYLSAAKISDPVNLYDAAPLADGAAAVLLAGSSALPPDPPYPVVKVAGSASSTSALAAHDRRDPLTMPAAAESVHQAIQQSGLHLADISLFELHDRYSIYAALALEAAGFAGRGEGCTLAQNGAIALDGRIPISTFGGSKARGDAGAATGLYQIAEAVRQLQSRAGENQVADAQVALVQCLGGAGASAATHVLQRPDQGASGSDSF